MADFGYDVSDHCDVDPIFGSLADFDQLIEEAHARGLKVILDFVPNHTSDRHPWFRDSRSARDSAKRDWYVWRDPKPDGSPPSNWLSEFGGPAWTLDRATGQYYYHAYLPEQPDLNWRNPEVRAAMLDVLRFWFERGVDGFRADAIHHLFEDKGLRDNPPNPDWRAGMSPARRVIRAHTMDQPEVHEAIALMRRVADEYGDRLLIGEAYLPFDRLMAYYGVDLGGFHLPFNFELIFTPWQPAAVASLVAAYEAALPEGAWPNWVLGNHDRPRVASRIGLEQARVAAMLLLTLRGTPAIYQGEEIGMRDVPIPPERVQDPWGKNVPGFGRDPVRTPMPWTADPGGGFTSGKPWLPIGPALATVNVASQSADPRSMLSLYRDAAAVAALGARTLHRYLCSGCRDGPHSRLRAPPRGAAAARRPQHERRAGRDPDGGRRRSSCRPRSTEASRQSRAMSLRSGAARTARPRGAGRYSADMQPSWGRSRSRRPASSTSAMTSSASGCSSRRYEMATGVKRQPVLRAMATPSVTRCPERSGPWGAR
jgi:alpha-glucosidase